jgi:hypothetical protein
LRDRRQHSGIFDVRANTDTDHLSGSCRSYEETVVSKQAIKSDMESFGPKKLNEMEGKEQNQVKISIQDCSFGKLWLQQQQ